MTERDFADSFVAFARGEISKCEMDAAIERLNADILKSRPKVPVKFSAEGTPYVSSAVSAIAPEKLEAMIQAEIERRKVETEPPPSQSGWWLYLFRRWLQRKKADHAPRPERSERSRW